MGFLRPRPIPPAVRSYHLSCFLFATASCAASPFSSSNSRRSRVAWLLQVESIQFPLDEPLWPLGRRSSSNASASSLNRHSTGAVSLLLAPTAVSIKYLSLVVVDSTTTTTRYRDADRSASYPPAGPSFFVCAGRISIPCGVVGSHHCEGKGEEELATEIE